MSQSKKRYVLFGAGQAASAFVPKYAKQGTIVAVADNDPAKWGGSFWGSPIVSPESILSLEWDAVVISSTASFPIGRQLINMGVLRQQIISPLWSDQNVDRWDAYWRKNLNKRVFVVGNGPSLRIQDLDRLHEHREHSFGFNKIYLTFDRSSYRPTYYVVDDNLVVENCASEIRELIGFEKFFPDHLASRMEVHSGDACLFNYQFQDPDRYEPAFSDYPLSIHTGYTVTFTALQIALWMGYDEVVLIGVDFAFSVPSIGKDGVIVNGLEQNHFDSNYRMPGERWNPPFLTQTRRAYELARKVADEKGIRILNATRGGALDVFPRVDFDSLW